MRIAYIALYTAWPPSSGAASVTHHCAKHSPGERLLVQFGPVAGSCRTPDGVQVATVRAASGRVGKLAGMHGAIGQIVGHVRAFRPDVVVLEGASWVVYHRWLTRALRAALPTATIVYHAHNVEYLLRRERQGALIGAITRWAEGRLLSEVDQAVAVSDVDGQHFRRLYGARLGLLPNGVDCDLFDAVTDDEARAAAGEFDLTDETVLFMGSYAYRPNQEAIDFLIGDVFPRIVPRHPHARLLVAGGMVPQRRPWLLNPGIVPFERLPGLVRACRIGVAPIFSGSGTRLKILEYLAAGLPVVATAKGAEGLALDDERHLLLAETAPAFAAAIERLLDDARLAAACGRQGQFAVRERYSYQAVLDQFIAGLPRADAREVLRHA
jgi:glycosyltransferase involved in cell wall biosynthesis